MKKNRKFIYIIAGFIIFCLLLLITDRRILVYENTVYATDSVYVKDKGFIDVLSDRKKYLDCTYFTGRTFVTASFWYASNNIMGKDSCPFLTKR
jgi:hypothetical protein